MTPQAPITNIAPALARAQLKIAVADKNAINDEHKSRYADLASIILACREALAEQEISILQPLGGSSSELLVNTLLIHSSGESLESEIRIRPEDPNDTDAVASLVTKWRRYGLQSMLCIASADDDGAGAKPMPKKEVKPVQEKGPVIEKHNAETPDPALKVSTVETNDAWKEVVCHVGTDTSPCKDKKLGELTPTLREWLLEKVVPTLGKTKKDLALAAAITESVKGPELPLGAPKPLPEPEKGEKQPQNAKKEASSESPTPAEPMEWRSVVAHNFKPNPKITLGEIADSEPDAIAKSYDGAKILRGMKSEGIAKIQAKAQTTKDKILVNAILAANDELDLREEIVSLFDGANLPPDEAADHLIKNGVLEEGETLYTVPPKMLAYLRDKWSEIEKTIKEAKK